MSALGQQSPSIAPVVEPPARAQPGHHRRHRRGAASRSPSRWPTPLVVAILWAAALVAASGGLAARQGWWTWDAWWSRAGAAAATWLALVVVTRRTGGRAFFVGGFAAVVLVLAVALPQAWALSGAAVVGGVAYGLLGVLTTRPARGWRALRELAWAVAAGLLGAVVVTGYEVTLRPYRFRVMVMALACAAALAVAWRLGGRSAGRPRRRVIVLVVGVALLLVAAVVYLQAIRHWGSPAVVTTLSDAKADAVDWLGAAPRLVEAVVGFTALVWGVLVRARRPGGWWICGFGALGPAGLAASLVRPAVPLGHSLLAGGYDVVIGAVLGLLVAGIDRLLTGSGRRSRDRSDVTARREPSRLAALR